MDLIEDIVRKYRLAPLEGEGGWFRFLTRFSDCNAGSILYLVSRDSFSSLHRLDTDELWFFLDGGAAEQVLFDEETGTVRRHRLDRDNRSCLAPAGLWQSTRLVRGEWALFSTVMCPQFSPAMYSAPTARLLEANPFLKEYLNA